MRRPVLPAMVALLVAVLLAFALPGTAQNIAAAAPAPTASPRDFNTLAPNGELSQEAVKAESAILVDSLTGKALYEKNADAKQFPASTTKIMTCLLAIESGKLAETITVGKLPKLEAGSTTIGLKQGETMKLEDMLHGLMMESGNDAAQAIAIYLGGSIEGFATMMNDKAKELGMSNTHYVNPHGLQNAEHYTTARDMATLAVAASKHQEFRDIVSTYKYEVPATNKNKARVWYNSNRLISQKENEVYAYQYATGIKTGYTTAAKSALVSSAQKDGTELVTVVLRDGSLEKWTDSITMFEYGFTFFSTLNLSDMMSAQTLTVPVPEAAETDPEQGQLVLQLMPDNTVTITDRKERITQLSSDIKQFEQKVELNPEMKAPITKDQEMGTVTFSLEGSPVLVCKLLASRDVAAKAGVVATATPKSSVQPQASPGVTPATPKKNSAGIWLIGVGLVILLLLAALLTIRFINLRRRNSKPRHYNYRQRSSTKRKR